LQQKLPEKVEQRTNYLMTIKNGGKKCFIREKLIELNHNFLKAENKGIVGIILTAGENCLTNK